MLAAGGRATDAAIAHMSESQCQKTAHRDDAFSPVKGASKKLPPWAFILAFAALAAFCFVVAGGYAFERIQVLRTFERVVGEVTAELRHSSQVSADARRPPYRAITEVIDYTPVVRFETAQGTVITVTGKVRSSLFRHDPGQKLPVFYDPHDPQQAMLGTFLEFWAPILVWAGFGLLWALAAYGAERLTRPGADRRRRAKRIIASVWTGGRFCRCSWAGSSQNDSR